jgi:hypothetical protein
VSPTTRRIREMSFRVVECDVPEELTLDDYRRRRDQRPVRRNSTRRGAEGRPPGTEATSTAR